MTSAYLPVRHRALHLCHTTTRTKTVCPRTASFVLHLRPGIGNTHQKRIGSVADEVGAVSGGEGEMLDATVEEVVDVVVEELRHRSIATEATVHHPWAVPFRPLQLLSLVPQANMTITLRLHPNCRVSTSTEVGRIPTHYKVIITLSKRNDSRNLTSIRVFLDLI